MFLYVHKESQVESFQLTAGEDVERVIQGQVDAFNNRNLDKFVSYYVPDIVILDGQGKTMMKGHDGMRAFYGKLFEQSPKLHVEIKTRIIVEHHVIDEEQVSGINLEGFPSELHSAAIYRIADGKIVHAQFL